MKTKKQYQGKTYLPVFMMIVISAFCSKMVAQPSSNGLIAYWPMDNSVADVSGNNHTLHLINGTSFTTDHIIGTHALSFDGENDYAVTDTIDLGDHFSILLWAKLPPSSGIKTLIANSASGISNGFKIYVNTYLTNDRKILFESSSNNNWAGAKSFSNIFDFNQWNLIAVTYDTGMLQIYYNGANVELLANFIYPIKVKDVIRLGMMTSNNYPLKGALDDVRIYNRVLSQAEIIQAAAAGGLPSPIPAAPTDLSVSDVNSTYAKLTWKDNSSNEDGFVIERSTNPTSGFKQFGRVGPNITQANVLVSSPTHYYRVRAYKRLDESDPTNIVQVIPIPHTTSDLIARWPLDEPIIDGSYNPDLFGYAPDVSGNNNNLFYPAWPGFSDDHIEGSHSLAFNESRVKTTTLMNLGDKFTILLWAKVTGTWNIQTLMANTRSGNGNGFKLMINTYQTNDRKIIFETGDGVPGGEVVQTTSNVGVFSLNEWNHVAAVVNRSTGEVTLYYNGTNVTYKGGYHVNFNTGDILGEYIWLGSMDRPSPYISIYPLLGYLDDVRIYKGLLTQAEINAIMNESNMKNSVSYEELKHNGLKLYPNPFNTALNIQDENIVRVEILSISGTKIIDHSITNGKLTIDTSELSRGIYVVKATYSDGSIRSEKAIKQ